MSKESNITASDRLIPGEDKVLEFLIVDAAGAPLDVSTFTLEWVLEKAETDILTKSGAAITVANGDGTNDAVSVAIDSADTAGLEPRTYQHALWRTDTGARQLLSSGDAEFIAAATSD